MLIGYHQYWSYVINEVCNKWGKSQGGLRKHSKKLNLFNFSLVYLVELAFVVIFIFCVCFSKLHNYIPIQSNLMCSHLTQRKGNTRSSKEKEHLFIFKRWKGKHLLSSGNFLWTKRRNNLAKRMGRQNVFLPWVSIQQRHLHINRPFNKL